MIVIVDRNDNIAVKKIDKGVRNKWNWAWIEKKISVHIGKTLPKDKMDLHIQCYSDSPIICTEIYTKELSRLFQEG